jgi:hypothetical protein
MKQIESSYSAAQLCSQMQYKPVPGNSTSVLSIHTSSCRITFAKTIASVQRKMTAYTRLIAHELCCCCVLECVTLAATGCSESQFIINTRELCLLS